MFVFGQDFRFCRFTRVVCFLCVESFFSGWLMVLAYLPTLVSVLSGLILASCCHMLLLESTDTPTFGFALVVAAFLSEDVRRQFNMERFLESKY